MVQVIERKKIVQYYLGPDIHSLQHSSIYCLDITRPVAAKTNHDILGYLQNNDLIAPKRDGRKYK